MNKIIGFAGSSDHGAVIRRIGGRPFSAEIDSNFSTVSLSNLSGSFLPMTGISIKITGGSARLCLYDLGGFFKKTGFSNPSAAENRDSLKSLGED